MSTGSIDERINKEIVAEDASIWYISDDYGSMIAVKLPSNVLKSVINGCPVDFLFGKDFRGENIYFHTGIRIHDDPVHFISIIGTHRFHEEHEALGLIMKQPEIQIVLYNEFSVCVASGIVNISLSDRNKVVKFQGAPTELYSGDFDAVAISSLDCFDFSLDNKRPFKDVYEIELLLVKGTFSQWKFVDVHFVGLNEANLVSVNDSDEGGSFEKQIWASLENIFHFDLYKNSTIGSGKKKREFIDILAFHKLGIILIESKALSVIAVDRNKSMAKKVSSLQKHINKGIGQLIGAKKGIEKGVEIRDINNRVITFNRNIIPHCIVLVSELLPFGDWSEIQEEMERAIREENIYLNVMDFKELITLLKACKGSKEYFDCLLMERTGWFVKTKNILMKSVIQVNKQ
jgi:hypothetical protein